MDITIRERIVFPVETLPVLNAYAEYHDLPADALIGVYSLNEIATEKIVALFDPARNEPRLKKLWSVRFSAQMTELPEFDEGVFLPSLNVDCHHLYLYTAIRSEIFTILL